MLFDHSGSFSEKIESQTLIFRIGKNGKPLYDWKTTTSFNFKLAEGEAYELLPKDGHKGELK